MPATPTRSTSSGWSSPAAGSSFQYSIVGWATFRLTDYKFKGNGGEISGYFVSVAWEGAPTEETENYFGAKVVKIVG